MKKIKKTFLHILGSFIAFIFSCSGAFAQSDGIEDIPLHPLYGADFEPRLTIWERIISIIFSPVAIVIVAILAIVIGIFIFVKRSRKNVKKNS